MNTSEILAKAADLIEQRGHWKGWYCGPNGELCFRGAIYAALGLEFYPDDGARDWPSGFALVVTAGNAEGAALRFVPGGNTATWNDADATTAAEVRNALRAAAEAARAET